MTLHFSPGSSQPTKSTSAKGWQGESRWLVLLLAYVLIRGVLQVAVVPPWQHPDEPTHFEYVRLIAEEKRLPKTGDYSLSMRREIAASMFQFDFWSPEKLPFSRQFLSNTPPHIGISELRHPPLYYALAALTQWPVSHAPVEMQLYAARLLGVLALMATILIAYRLVKALFPGNRLIYLGVPACLALLPPYIDQVTSVNNDVLTIPLFSLFLLMLVQLIHEGMSWRRLGLAVVLLALAMMTKTTTAIGVLALLVALPMAIFRQPWSRRLWLALGGGILALGLIFLQWGDAAGWYKFGGTEFQSSKNRARLPTPLGYDALYVEDRSENERHYLLQELPEEQGKALAGKPVTLAGWVRSVEPSKAIHPVGSFSLYDGQTRHQWTVEASSAWVFHTFTTTIAADARLIQVELHPYLKGKTKTGAFYVTGLALVEGADWPQHQPPAWNVWGDSPFENLIHNGTGHRGMLSLRSTWGGSHFTYLWRDQAKVLQSALEWRRTGQFSRLVIANLYQGFWGRFSWNKVALPAWGFQLLLLPTIAGGTGMLRLLLREFGSKRASLERWQRRSLLLLAITFALAWINAWLRAHPYFLTQYKFISGARYTYPVVAVSVMFLLMGILEWWPRRWRPQILYFCTAGMLLLDVFAWLGVFVSYYYAAS